MVEIKGRRLGDAGRSPSPGHCPASAGRLLPADTASHHQTPPQEQLHFQGELRCHCCAGKTTSPAPCMAWRPLRGGRCRAGTRPPPHSTPIACQPKAACPVALNSAWGLILHLVRGEHPRRRPATPPGVCQALIRLCACRDAAGFSSQPGKEASAQPGAERQWGG